MFVLTEFECAALRSAANVFLSDMRGAFGFSYSCVLHVYTFGAWRSDGNKMSYFKRKVSTFISETNDLFC